MLSQQPQHAIFGGADAFVTQPRPDLPITFSAENGLSQELANPGDQLLVREHLRTALLRLPRPLHTLPGSIEARSRQVPHRRHTRYTVRLVTGRRNGAAHHFDFHGAKGRPFSRRAIFSRSSSFSMLTLATTDF